MLQIKNLLKLVKRLLNEKLSRICKCDICNKSLEYNKNFFVLKHDGIPYMLCETCEKEIFHPDLNNVLVHIFAKNCGLHTSREIEEMNIPDEKCICSICDNTLNVDTPNTSFMIINIKDKSVVICDKCCSEIESMLIQIINVTEQFRIKKDKEKCQMTNQKTP